VKKKNRQGKVFKRISKGKKPGIPDRGMNMRERGTTLSCQNILARRKGYHEEREETEKRVSARRRKGKEKF